LEDFEPFKNGPRVIVTSTASFEYGFSRKLVRDFVAKDSNEIIFI
jgi:hypothetical protein